MGFSFSQVEAALAEVHEIADNKRSAFANRLKHLQKLGFLPETRTGRGKAASYAAHHIYLLGVALELNELGLTPERAMAVIDRNMHIVALPAGWAISTLNESPDKPHLYFLRFDPSSLNSLRYDNPEDDDAVATLFYAGRGTLIEDIDSMGTLWPRFAIINITSLIAQTFSALHRQGPELGEEFETDLMVWLNTHAYEDSDGDDTKA